MLSNQLIHAASETDANLRYLTDFLAPDAFTYLSLKGKTYLLLSDLEVDRGRKQSIVNSVLSLSELQKKYSPAKGKPAPLSLIISMLCQSKGISKLAVPHSFPLGLALPLQKLGLTLEPQAEPFAKNRLQKKKWELDAIVAVQRANEKAMKSAYELLRESEVRGKDKGLYIGSQPLTSEFIRKAIDQTLLKENCLGLNTIVAGGEHAADPHDRGTGPLYAEESIIIDIFPSSLTSGYFADMSRTFCKGKAPDKLKRVYQAVLKAQETALKSIKAGVSVQKPDQVVREVFKKLKFPTKKQNGRWVGFFHGTGHGVGLEIHEAPSLSQRGQGELKAGMVVTIEPGLYYPWGGVRLEDFVSVTAKGCVNLTQFPKVLEIP